MRYRNILYIIAMALLFGIAIFMNNLGPYRAWLATGVIILGAVLLAAGVVQMGGRMRRGVQPGLSLVATAALGVAVVLVGVDMLWPSYGLDKPGYGLLFMTIVLSCWPRKSSAH